MKNKFLIVAFFSTLSFINAQDKVTTTGVPFLLVAGDGRAAGMGDNGVATSPDVYSQQWNPSKYAFSIDKQGFSVGYTPYLQNLVNDISLSQITYFNKFNERSAFAASIRYFSLGEIEFRQEPDDPPLVVKPAEYALDLSYALKLSDYLSMSVAGRYINSNLRFPTLGQSSSSAPASSFAFDVSGFYQSEEMSFDSFNGKLRVGFNFQNLGPKINYDKSVGEAGSNFLPSNLKLGAGFDFILDDYNKVSVSAEFNKLLVPTPLTPTPEDLNGDGDTTDSEEETAAIQQANIDYDKIGWVSGVFKSFNDASGGIREELNEITTSLGVEYLYQDSFAFRLGYFYEDPSKGARKFFTLGAGFKYNVIKVDFSYLFSASKVNNPLENTLRFSLSFAFGDKYDEF
jgi:hypothetical protein